MVGYAYRRMITCSKADSLNCVLANIVVYWSELIAQSSSHSFIDSINTYGLTQVLLYVLWIKKYTKHTKSSAFMDLIY